MRQLNTDCADVFRVVLRRGSILRCYGPYKTRAAATAVAKRIKKYWLGPDPDIQFDCWIQKANTEWMTVDE